MSNRTLHEDSFWTPEPMWAGEQVFVLASGPSLTQATCDRLRGRHVMVVNSTCNLAPWAEVLFFTDNSWFEPRREMVANWSGLVVSMSRAAKRTLPDKIKRVRGELRDGFPPFGSPVIRQGRSSGHSALSLAVALGPKQIVMLGFDMRVVDGREHHHEEYSGPRDLDQYAREFVPAFDGWNAAALKAGVTILNATPGSALLEFPFCDLSAALRPQMVA